ncbi:MAG: hypothetical protein E7259_07330 [Lachnospiraceae bacterium]|nr:hypothetical protein [Lachnospiraceae bacterium]
MKDINILKEKAQKGRLLWLELVEKYNIDDATFVVLLPDTNRRDNECAMKYTDAFLTQKYAKKALVLSHDEWVRNEGMKLTGNAEYVEFDRESAKALMQFYCLYEFAPNLVIASLTEPSGRLGEKLVGHKEPALSYEEVFKAVVYRLWD